jgi:hypothetical protein
MERDEILNMPAGTKMNQLVWWKIFDMEPYPPNNDMLLLPDYSHEIAPAWSIIEKLVDGTPNDFELRTTIRGWRCDLYLGSANAETAPLAICRAGLIAVLAGSNTASTGQPPVARLNNHTFKAACR